MKPEFQLNKKPVKSGKYYAKFSTLKERKNTFLNLFEKQKNIVF